MPAPPARLTVDQLAVTQLLPGQMPRIADGLFSGRTERSLVFSQMRSGRMEVERNGVTALVRAGEAYLARPGDRSRQWHHAPAPGGTFSAIWCFAGFTAFGAIDVGAALDLPPVLDRVRADAIARTLEEAIAVVGDGVAQQVRRCELGFRLLGQLLAIGGLTRDGAALLAGADRLSPVLAWCRERIAERISPADLARVAGCSRARLYALFHEHLGCAPRQWIMRLRLERARQLLLAGESSVAAIAEAVGFANPYHFSRAFRAATGEAPGRWRRARSYLDAATDPG